MHLNQMASQVALVKDLYSTSVDDKEQLVVSYCSNDMTPEPMLNAYPKVDFLSSEFHAQSKLE